MISGHHISKDFLMPQINEELICVQESENPHHPYTFVIKQVDSSLSKNQALIS